LIGDAIKYAVLSLVALDPTLPDQILNQLGAVRQGDRFYPSAGSQMLHELAFAGRYHFFAFSPVRPNGALYIGAQPAVEGKGERQVSIYFGITGWRDYRVIPPHFNETHVNQDPQVTRADWYYLGALALYVVQYPAKSDSVFESKAAKACLWFRHFPFAPIPIQPCGKVFCNRRSKARENRESLLG
jgi:hypothetical protein